MLYNFKRATRMAILAERTLAEVAKQTNPRLGGKYAELFASGASAPSGNFRDAKAVNSTENYTGLHPQVA